MALSLGINRDLQVSFPISEVKSAIEKVSAASKSKYQIENKDDILNSFSMALIGGLAVIVPVTIQLKKVSDTETQIILASTRATNSANQANDIVDKFLGLVSKVLSGEDITQPAGAESKSGCFGVIAFFILLAVTIGWIS